MATTTTNLGLKKPALTDDALISDINDNMDDLDSVIGAVPSGTSLYTAIGNLNNKIKTVSSGSLHDIAGQSGVFWLTSDVTDKPESGAGILVFSSYSNSYCAGIYTVADNNHAYSVTLVNNTWKYEPLPVNSTKIVISQSITTSTTLTYTGVSATIPAGKEFAVLAKASYQNNEPLEIALSTSNSAIRPYNTLARTDNASTISFAGYTDSSYIGSITLHVWARYASSGSNGINVSGYYR